jgi:hypothetical protein
MKLTNPLEQVGQRAEAKTEMTPETISELKDMERKYRESHVGSKINL